MLRRGCINAPTKALTDADYASECRFCLEPSLARMIELAVAAGWNRKQVVLATIFLAVELMDDDSSSRYLTGCV